MMEEKSVKAVIQALDLNENPIGKPIEVYNYAVLVLVEEEIKVKDIYGGWHYANGLVVITGGEEIPLCRVYQESWRWFAPLFINVQDDRVIVWYPHYHKYLDNIKMYRKRKSGEKIYQPMKTREVLKEGEYVDIKMPYVYREIDRQISIGRIIPIVDSNVLIRIEARKLEKELYQK